MPRLAILVSGLLFGAGLTLSAMVNPAKILNFLDIAGNWDPTLILVMGAGLAVTFLGYRIVFRRPGPLFERAFVLPSATAPDTKLLGGAALFGLGWGLTGFCPGPAIAALAFGHWQTWLFVASMTVGMIAVKMLSKRPDTAQLS